MPDQTKQEKRAAADAAKSKATEARQAADASPEDTALQTAATEAEAESVRLEKEATAPSHDTRSERPKSEKIKKRMEILRSDLRAALIAEGKDPDEMTDEQIAAADQRINDADDADDIPDDKPLTKRDLEKIERNKSKVTAKQKAEAITDSDLRAVVIANLARIVPSGNADQDYADAVAMASSSKNSRIASEAVRIAKRTPQQHVSGGAGARDDSADFVPTPLEQSYMKKFKLTEADIKKGRQDAATMNFGQGQKD